MSTRAAPAFVRPVAPPRLVVPPPTRERILAAARALLRANGYAGFTMEGVALESGLTRRTLYNQFADRDALYLASRLILLGEFEHLLPREIVAGDLLAEFEHFLSLALEALAHPAHVELARSAEFDNRAFPGIAELYENRVLRPLREATGRYLALLGLSGADAGGRAEDLVAMLRAATHGGRPAPIFTPDELAGIFIGRIRAGAATS